MLLTLPTLLWNTLSVGIVVSVNIKQSGQIYLREQDVLEGRRLRALTLGREGDADLGEEVLHRCRGCQAAKVLPHHPLGAGPKPALLWPPVWGIRLSQIVDSQLSNC